MTTNDRDNYFALMVFYEKLLNWQKDAESEINVRDKAKLKMITDTIVAMMVQYRKQEGETALNTLIEQSGNYKFAILDKNENLEINGTFEPDIIKGAMKKVAQKCTDCVFCEKKDYKKCEWYTLHKFMETLPCNLNKNECPFKNKDNFMDL